jgi:hypothetical protein
LLTGARNTKPTSVTYRILALAVALIACKTEPSAQRTSTGDHPGGSAAGRGDAGIVLSGGSSGEDGCGPDGGTSALDASPDASQPGSGGSGMGKPIEPPETCAECFEACRTWNNATGRCVDAGVESCQCVAFCEPITPTNLPCPPGLGCALSGKLCEYRSPRLAEGIDCDVDAQCARDLVCVRETLETDDRQCRRACNSEAAPAGCDCRTDVDSPDAPFGVCW